MLCLSLMHDKIRLFLIIILELENLRMWFIRDGQKPKTSSSLAPSVA